MTMTGKKAIPDRTVTWSFARPRFTKVRRAATATLFLIAFIAATLTLYVSAPSFSIAGGKRGGTDRGLVTNLRHSVGWNRPDAPPPSDEEKANALESIRSMQQQKTRSGQSTDAPNVVHTFFHHLPRTDPVAELETLRAWSEAWTDAGWETRILSLSDAERHPRYEEYSKRIDALPLGTNPEYDRMCYLRWLAVAASGGGWMADYDAIPLDFFPPDGLPNDGRFTSLSYLVPALVVGSAENWNAMIELMIDTAEEAVQSEESLSYRRSANLFSDMHAMHAIERKYGQNDERFVVTNPALVMGATSLLPEVVAGQICCECDNHWNAGVVHFSHNSMEGDLGVSVKNRPYAMRKTRQAYLEQCAGIQSQ